jgi:hypothetical protein
MPRDEKENVKTAASIVTARETCKPVRERAGRAAAKLYFTQLGFEINALK